MLVPIVLLLCLGASIAEKQYYDTWLAEEITEEAYQEHIAENTAYYCTIEIEECNETEGRRLDGSCNNLKNPSMGAAHTVVRRVLDADYGENFEPRLAKSGNALPLSRSVRTGLLPEGRIPSQNFTHTLTNFWLFMALDGTLSADTLNYVINIPYCCQPRGATDMMCTPNKIPADDPIHRFSEVRCMNMTRPTSYQNQNCTANTTTPDRLNTASPPYDLSFLYGTILANSNAARLNESGLLIFEVDEQGKHWPPSITESPESTCRLNVAPAETRCNRSPVPVTNTLLGANVFLIWLWRNHNRIARELASLNPNWDDEKLFFTARDINIATTTQILFYELFPLMLGEENLINDNVIGSDGGFRDMYNETVSPQMSYEYLYALRWVHTIQDGTVKQYDAEGNYLKQIPIGNLTFRTGYLTVDGNFESITQGMFRQPCGQHDYVVDPDVSELSLGPLQRSLDLLLNDHAKGRYLGLQPYVKYLEFCNAGKSYTKWSDLLEFIDHERVEQLMNVYENVLDIELLAGIWVERPVRGGAMPPTAYCLVTNQLIYNQVSDRHWYERENRPNAFTAAQLKQIRNASISRLLCEVADGVTEIQPEAFRRISDTNALVSCDSLPKIDLTAWQENSA